MWNSPHCQMDSLKRPEMILSVTNTIGMVSSIIYFYKRTSALQDEIEKINTHLTATVKKVSELPDNKEHIGQLADAINQLNRVSQMNRSGLAEIKDILTSQEDDITQLKETLDAVVEACQELGVNVRIPKAKRITKKPKPLSRTSRPPPRAKPEPDPEPEDEPGDEPEPPKPVPRIPSRPPAQRASATKATRATPKPDPEPEPEPDDPEEDDIAQTVSEMRRKTRKT